MHTHLLLKLISWPLHIVSACFRCWSYSPSCFAVTTFVLEVDTSVPNQMTINNKFLRIGFIAIAFLSCMGNNSYSSHIFNASVILPLALIVSSPYLSALHSRFVQSSVFSLYFYESTSHHITLTHYIHYLQFLYNVQNQTNVILWVLLHYHIHPCPFLSVYDEMGYKSVYYQVLISCTNKFLFLENTVRCIGMEKCFPWAKITLFDST